MCVMSEYPQYLAYTLDEDEPTGHLVEYETGISAATKEELVQKIGEKDWTDFSYYVKVKISPFAIVPEEIWEELPSPPHGLTLLILYRISHNTAGDYDWRYFAVPPSSTIHLNEISGEFLEIWDQATVLGTLDSNSESIYILPKGSMQYVDGSWVVCERVEYYY